MLFNARFTEWLYYDKLKQQLEQNDLDKSQHKGFGKKLLAKAEQIALSKGYKKIAVIAGVGVREYYRANGYTIDSKEGCYQIKILENLSNQTNNNFDTYKYSSYLLYISYICFGIILIIKIMIHYNLI